MMLYLFSWLYMTTWPSKCHIPDHVYTVTPIPPNFVTILVNIIFTWKKMNISNPKNSKKLGCEWKMTQNDPNWNYLRDKFPQNDPFTNMTMANNLVYAQKRIVKKKNSWKMIFGSTGTKNGSHSTCYRPCCVQKTENCQILWTIYSDRT